MVLYLGGGNDALSTLVPYTDPFYESLRPTQAVPAGVVLPVGSDSTGVVLGLHPNLPGLQGIFNEGRLALIQRTGYPNPSRSHFQGTDIWGTANPAVPQGTGWLGRYLDSLPAPVDPLTAWNTMRETPRALQASAVGVPSIPAVDSYVFASPNSGTEAQLERDYAVRLSSHLPAGRPQLAFVNATAQSALATLDRVATVSQYTPSVGYPADRLGQALQTVAGALARSVGTRIFWVQLNGFDTHANQNTLEGTYGVLMGTLNNALAAFYDDLRNQGLLSSTLVLQFSEFGRRIAENGSGGTDHGAAGLMMAIGGTVRGGLYGTAATLDPSSGSPTLENNGRDVAFGIDFRSVYARVIDDWLAADSLSLLGGDFRNAQVDFL